MTRKAAGVSNASTSITFGSLSITNLYSNEPGPTFGSGSFQASGGNLLIEVSGSGWTNTAPSNIGLNLALNGNALGITQVWANASETHLTFTPVVLQAQSAVGSNTITVTPFSGTIVDQNDNLNVTITEYVPAT
jgi:hypothetical protein